MLQRVRWLPFLNWESSESDSKNFPINASATSLRTFPYPELARVCSRWRRVLDSADARRVLSKSVVIDFPEEVGALPA